MKHLIAPQNYLEIYAKYIDRAGNIGQFIFEKKKSSKKINNLMKLFEVLTLIVIVSDLVNKIYNIGRYIVDFFILPSKITLSSRTVGDTAGFWSCRIVPLEGYLVKLSLNKEGLVS